MPGKNRTQKVPKVHLAPQARMTPHPGNLQITKIKDVKNMELSKIIYEIQFGDFTISDLEILCKETKQQIKSIKQKKEVK